MNYMATAVETLGKLERRVTLSFPMAAVKAEVEKRLKQHARQAKAPGFRPGKVPMKMVAAMYGYQTESEVLNDQVGRAFNDIATSNQLRVAGLPSVVPKDGAEGELTFEATFEIFPEVEIGDLSKLTIEKVTASVSDAEIDKTIDILRKQRVHFHVKGEAGEHGDGGPDVAAKSGDRVTIDFVGKIDGVEFDGGKADAYPFVLGEGRMLPEFEAAATGLKVGETKVATLNFPADYHGADVAGKTAEFSITLKKLEWPHLPEVDAEFAKSLGIADGNLDKMREDIKNNLAREVSGRVKAINKDAVMNALLATVSMDLPKVLVTQDVERLIESARADVAKRGMDPAKMPFPPEQFTEQAERRVRLGLILAQLVKQHDLQVKPEQVKAKVEDFAQSYEDPMEVLKYYFADRSRLGEVEALVLEENVVNYVLGVATVTEKTAAFDELMGNNPQA